MKGTNSRGLLALTDEERLLRHNLETRQYWSASEMEPLPGISTGTSPGEPRPPAPWVLTKGITLYDWQEDCINTWLKTKRGTIKVVTGAGKTILALAIMERLQALHGDLRVAIVVPTIVLQDQWYKEIITNGNLTPDSIGRLGGGHGDDFTPTVRILICVLKSASRRLATIVAKSGIGPKLLLVADECHRAGAPDMSRVFATKRAYNLGLSATPEREDANEEVGDDGNRQYDSSLLGRELGPIVYAMTVHEAFQQGILPAFEIHHYGLPLTQSERENYQRLTRRLRDAAANLRELGHRYGLHDANIVRQVQRLTQRDDELGLVARQYSALANGRRRLLFDAVARPQAVVEILQSRFGENAGTRAILFHESIENVMNLYHGLLGRGFPVAVEHSMLPENIREESIGLFRQGIARIIVSARSLIEGFNVPETDIGIIVASSTSIRQRIQTIGRLLRRGQRGEKIATIYILYIHDTVDEVIYGRADWDSLLGAQRNRYFLWNAEQGLVEQKAAPRAPLPREADIDLQDLVVGEEYPGSYEGIEYTCDSDGNVFTTNQDVIHNPQGVPERVRKVKGSYGKFKVTAEQRFILVLVSEEDEWVVKYAGQLVESFISTSTESEPCSSEEWNAHELQAGDAFPARMVEKESDIVYFKQSRGRSVLAKKEGRGERFARMGEFAADQEKGDDAQQLIAICNQYRTTHPGLNKLFITKSRHVVFLKDGQYRYLYTLTAGLEFS